MMTPRVDLLAWSCLFLAVESKLGPVLPPQNVSLRWVSGFQARLSWTPPPQLGPNCSYEVFLKTREGRERHTTENVEEQFYVVMEGGSLNITVRTVCGRRSELARVGVVHAELVTELQCYAYSATHTHCSWQPASSAPDLRFFYRLLKNNFSESGPQEVDIRECSRYGGVRPGGVRPGGVRPGGVRPGGVRPGGVRPGCDLEADSSHTLHILFNGTVNHTAASNTFKRNPSDDVRPPPLNWTVTKTRDKFFIRWTRPEIERRWKFEINYTECRETKSIAVDGGTSMELDRVPRCAYRMAVRAFMEDGKTPFSDPRYFDADPNAWPYAAIILPVTFASLAALVLVCCRRNKEYMFPKVPEPRDFLRDIPDNNNKIADHHLYVPAEEDEGCRITLVADAHLNGPDVGRLTSGCQDP